MIALKTKIAESILPAILSINAECGFTAEAIAEMFEYPPADKGDIALPCFKFSKALRMGPPQIASKLTENLAIDGIEKVETAGGYLNFYVKDEYLTKTVLAEILAKGKDCGKTDLGHGKTVLLDYSSPNVAKPFHIGHLGTTVIGHSLKMLHEYCGYKCFGINHLGDWGTQFGKLIVAYRRWGSREAVEEKGIEELVALYVRFHKEAEEDKALEDLARAEFTKLEHGDEDNLALWKWFVDISIREYKKTYELLGIEFDSYCGESFYTDKMDEQVNLLRDKGLLKIDEGASIVDLEEYKMPPCLILKKDGSTLYPTRDIAAAVYRKRTYDFEKCLYVTSAGQSLHFAQWFKVAELMGYDWANRLVHIPYGTVSINGAKLATRTGNVVLLADLFDSAIAKVKEIIEEKNPTLPDKDEVAKAVGTGAIVFGYLSNNRIKDINFILENALSIEGDTGPYAQYTYARASSILEKAGDFTPVTPAQINEHEKALIKTLALFKEKVLAAIADYEPSVIVHYILDVCSDFNRFYHECPINSAEGDTRSFRLSLCKGTQNVLGAALSLICMKAPEKI